MIVALDDGFARTKAVFFDKDGNLKLKSTASRASMGANSVTDIMGESVMGYETNGQAFTVGATINSASTSFDGYKISDLNRVIAHHALYDAGLGGQAIHLGVTVPFGLFYSKSEARMKREASLTSAVKRLDGQALSSVKSVRVFPEAAIAWMDVYIGNDGTVSDDITSNISTAIIDIGGRSTDIAVFHGPKMIDQKRSGTIFKGVHNIVEKIKSRVYAEFRGDLKENQMESIFKTQSINVYGKPVDISEIINEVKAEVANEIYLDMQSRIGKVYDIDRLVFIGGGARVLSQEMVSHPDYPHAEVPEHPEFANARGILKYMTFIEA